MNIHSVHQKVTTFAHKHSDTLFGLTFLMLFVFAPLANELNFILLFFCLLFYAYANVRVFKLLGYKSKSERSPLTKLVILTVGAFVQFFVAYFFFRFASFLAGCLPVIVAELVYAVVAGIGAYLFFQLQNLYHSFLVRGINLVPAILGGAEQVSRLSGKGKTMVTGSFTALFFIAFLFSLPYHHHLSIITFGLLTLGGLLLNAVNYYIYEVSQEDEVPDVDEPTGCPLVANLSKCSCGCSCCSRFEGISCVGKVGVAVQMLIQLFFKGVACAFQEFWAIFEIWKKSVSSFDKRRRDEQEVAQASAAATAEPAQQETSESKTEATATAKEFVKDVVHQAEEAAHELTKTAQEVLSQVVDAAEEKVQEFVDEATHTTVAEPQTTVASAQEEAAESEIARIVRQAPQPRVPFNKED